MFFLEDYVDTLESLPMELCRNFTLMKELDAMAQDIIKKVEDQTKTFMDNVKEYEREERINMLVDIGKTFRECLKHGEEKVALAIQTYDMVDRHIRRLDEDLIKFEEEQMTGPKMVSSAPSHTFASSFGAGSKDRLDAMRRDKRALGDGKSSDRKGHDTPQGRNKRLRTGRDEYFSRDPSAASASGAHSGNTPNKRDKGKAVLAQTTSKPGIGATSMASTVLNKNGKRTKEMKSDNTGRINPPLDLPIDPNEPTYCLCGQVSFGEMIACDNEYCEIEWFHYSCVGLDGPPKGKWYCPQCSEERKKM